MYGFEPEEIEQIVCLSRTHSVKEIAAQFHKDPARIRHVIEVYSDMMD